MTIGKRPRRQIILFVSLGGVPTLDESNADLLEVDSSKQEGIYTYNPSDY